MNKDDGRIIYSKQIFPRYTHIYTHTRTHIHTHTRTHTLADNDATMFSSLRGNSIAQPTSCNHRNLIFCIGSYLSLYFSRSFLSRFYIFLFLGVLNVSYYQINFCILSSYVKSNFIYIIKLLIRFFVELIY